MSNLDSKYIEQNNLLATHLRVLFLSSLARWFKDNLKSFDITLVVNGRYVNFSAIDNMILKRVGKKKFSKIEGYLSIRPINGVDHIYHRLYHTLSLKVQALRGFASINVSHYHIIWHDSRILGQPSNLEKLNRLDYDMKSEYLIQIFDRNLEYYFPEEIIRHWAETIQQTVIDRLRYMILSLE
jgi:hypothetical protein